MLRWRVQQPSFAVEAFICWTSGIFFYSGFNRVEPLTISMHFAKNAFARKGYWGIVTFRGHHSHLILTLETFSSRGTLCPKCFMTNHATFKSWKRSLKKRMHQFQAQCYRVLWETSATVYNNALTLKDSIYQKYFFH